MQTRLAGAVLAAFLAACSSDAAPEDHQAAAVSAPMSSVGPTTSASAAGSASGVVHDPGTVLVPVKPPPRPAASAAQAPLDVPLFERLPPSPGRRAGIAGSAGLLDALRVAFVGAGELHVLDVESGDGFSVRTGSPIAAWATTRGATTIAIVETTGRATIWDAARGALVRTWQLPAIGVEYPWALLSHDGGRLALATKELVVLDVASGDERFRKELESEAFGLAFTGTEIAVTMSNISIASWAVDQGVATGDASFQTGATFGVAVSTNTRWAAGAAEAGHGLQVSDLRSKGSHRQLVDGTTCDAHIAPAFSGDSRFVYAAAGSKWIKGFETGSWKPYASFHAPPGRSIVAHADDLSRVVTTDAGGGGDPRVVRVSDGHTTALAQSSLATTFTLSGDGTRVLGASDDAVTVWSATDGSVVYVVTR